MEYNTDLNLRSQFVTAKDFTKSCTLTYAFTENGVAMLSVGTGTTVITVKHHTLTTNLKNHVLNVRSDEANKKHIFPCISYFKIWLLRK